MQKKKREKKRFRCHFTIKRHHQNAANDSHNTQFQLIEWHKLINCRVIRCKDIKLIFVHQPFRHGIHSNCFLHFSDQQRDHCTTSATTKSTKFHQGHRQNWQSAIGHWKICAQRKTLGNFYMAFQWNLHSSSFKISTFLNNLTRFFLRFTSEMLSLYQFNALRDSNQVRNMF